MRQAVFLFSPELEGHPYPPECPFSVARAGRARRTVAGMGLLRGPGRRELGYGPATRAELLAGHAEGYLEALQAAERGEPVELAAFGLGTRENPVFPGMWAGAALACGGSLEGARLLLAGEADVVFHPAGGFHHAHAGRAGGFCYLNDAALACGLLAGAGRRVLYLDVDAHHGDGVQAAFYERADVMVVSLHETGRILFPFTGFAGEIGSGAGEGYTANLPLPPGMYDSAYLKAFRAVVPPLAGAFAPDAVVLELGMDALAGDPLVHWELTNNALAEALAVVLGWGLPLLVLGGGGYHVPNAARGWALAWSVICGEEDDDLNLGMGGVFLGSSEWRGGLRDRPRFPDEQRREAVAGEAAAAVAELKAALFPRHGLDPLE